jgi:hypothetical protein
MKNRLGSQEVECQYRFIQQQRYGLGWVGLGWVGLVGWLVETALTLGGDTSDLVMITCLNIVSLMLLEPASLLVQYRYVSQP